MNGIQLKIAAHLCRQVCASWLDSESNPSNEGRVVHCTVVVNYKDLSDQNQHRLVSLAAEIIKYILELHQTKIFTREMNRHIFIASFEYLSTLLFFDLL